MWMEHKYIIQISQNVILKFKIFYYTMDKIFVILFEPIARKTVPVKGKLTSSIT